MRLGCGDRPVFDAPRNDEELAFVQFDDSIAKVDGQVTAEDQEELVLALVVMQITRSSKGASGCHGKRSSGWKKSR